MHGFHPRHSFESQLICVLDDWTSALELGHQVCVIYLDLQKTFDKVPHARLLSNPESYKIGRKLLQWIVFIKKSNVCICVAPNQTG